MLPAICLEIPTEILSEISLVILQKVLLVIILLLTYSFGNSFQFLRFFFNSFVNIWVKFPMPSKKSSTTTLTFPSEIYLGIYLEISLGFLENVLIVYNNPVQNFPFYEKFTLTGTEIEHTLQGLWNVQTINVANRTATLPNIYFGNFVGSCFDNCKIFQLKLASTI